MSRSGHFFEGLFLGAVVGAALGVLFAPQSGEETRRRIKEAVKDNEHLINDVKESSEVVIAKTRDAIEKGISKLGEIVEHRKKDSSSRAV